MTIHFHKYHGAGNDFIMLNHFQSPQSLPQETIEQLCHRHYGIGADGLIQILPSSQHNFSMKYYNADGYEGSMCGNGGRCVALFAFDENICGQNMDFEAIDGIHHAHVEASESTIKQVALQMQDVKNWIDEKDHFFVDTGSPHYIKWIEKDLMKTDVAKQGKEIRYNYRKAGTNVNFLMKNANNWHIRTYERGVEDETLACGTGVTAAAIAIAEKENLSGKWIEINALGGKLAVYLEKDNSTYKNIILKGPAIKVFEGTIEI